MNVPTVVIFIVAPFNIFLNWLLVWGPIDAIRLGFRGAPLATGLSMNLEFALFLIYGRLWSDSAAWPGLNWRKAFKDLGTVAVLGLSGIGMVASEWWSWEIVTLAASMLGGTSIVSLSSFSRKDASLIFSFSSSLLQPWLSPHSPSYSYHAPSPTRSLSPSPSPPPFDHGTFSALVEDGKRNGRLGSRLVFPS